MSVDTPSAEVPRLLVRDLTVVTSRSGAEVVQAVTLEIASGQVLGIVGESGSGKTTLGLALLGYARRGLRIDRGSIELDGKDLLSLPSGELRSARGSVVSYVPQDPGTALNPSRRVGPQLREALTIHGVNRRQAADRVTELLAEVGLESVPGILSAYPHQLSGGQQQRVVIAMAFACRPRLIVLDEPTTGLDVNTQRTVLDTVRSLCARYGVAAAYVSHDVAVVREISQRVAVVYSGRVVEIGPTEELFTSPQHPYTRGLLQAVPAADQSLVLTGMEGFPPRPGQRPPGCAFAPRCPVRIDQCMTERPALLPSGRAEHLARCHLVSSSHSLLPLPKRRASLGLTASATEASVISIVGLTAKYGTNVVLKGVDLHVAPGECLAVVGESGSGKTTFARCLSGLHLDWSGSIMFEDAAVPAGIKNRSKRVLQDIQYIFQNPYASLNPRRTIGSLIAQPLDQFGALSRNEKQQRTLASLDAVSLPPDFLDQYPDQLSGGERQRVAIARALVVEPRVLICDEITSALDVSVQASVVETLSTLQSEKHLSLVFITHNLPLVRSIAQRVVVLDQGVIVETGPTESVLDHPQADYTRVLLSAAPGEPDVW